MSEFYEDALNLIFPIDEICMFCKKRTKLYKHYLCSSCYNNLNSDFYCCKYCGVFMIDRSFEICDDCANFGPYFNGFIKTYALDDLSKSAIYGYKNSRKRELSYCFASLLAERIKKSIDINSIDYIVPVPSSKYKLRKRGFDHISEITKKLSDLLKIKNEKFLVKTRETKEQKSLNRFDRLKNMEEVFALIKYTNLPINLLLVDDVLTTGTTMKASARALQGLNVNVFGVCVFHTQG